MGRDWHCLGFVVGLHMKGNENRLPDCRSTGFVHIQEISSLVYFCCAAVLWNSLSEIICWHLSAHRKRIFGNEEGCFFSLSA